MWQHRSLLGPGMASLWGVESPDDYITYGGGICLYYSAALQEAMHRLSITCLRDIDGLQEVVLSMFDWLRIQGVSHVVTPSPLPNFWPKQRFASHNIADVPELSGYQVHVYELVNPVQRVRLVPYLQKKVPTNNINIEKFLSLTDVNSLYETNFKDPPQIGSFRIISQTPHTMVVESECAQDSYLVIANTYDKNWRAMLDDISPQPVLRTNLSLQSVFVPKGNHRIKLYYYSPAFEIGWRISLASLVLFLSLILGWSIYKIKFNKK